MKYFRIISAALIIPALFLIASCEGGLEPPSIDSEPIGVIHGIINYSGDWPPADSLHELRFVALKSTPQSATDIISDFQNIPVSEKLDYFVERDTFMVSDVRNGAYVYNAIAQQYGGNIFNDWRPIGLYEENSGVIVIQGDTVSITIHVDFQNLPPFPPE